MNDRHRNPFAGKGLVGTRLVRLAGQHAGPPGRSGHDTVELGQERTRGDLIETRRAVLRFAADIGGQARELHARGAELVGMPVHIERKGARRARQRQAGQ